MPFIDLGNVIGPEGPIGPPRTLYELGARPNRNLARNPDFKINQRNFSSGNWTNRYGPDGWRSAGSGHLEYSGGAVKTVNQYLLQFYAPGEIKAGTYTVSAFCTDNIMVSFGNWGGTSFQRTSDNYENGLASVTFDVAADFSEESKNQYIYVMCQNSGTISFVKFEKSPFQTLAYKDSAGNWVQFEEIDYGAELARCQRQLRVLGQEGESQYGVYGTGMCISSTEARVFIPVENMRKSPAITVEDISNWQLSAGATTKSVSGISVNVYTGIGIVLSCTSTDLTVGTPCFLRNTGATAKIILSAEL